MNEEIIRAIDQFNTSPFHIDGVSNVNDLRRMYKIAIAVYETQGEPESVKQYLRENISREFIYRDKVLDDCIQCLEVVVPFLKYYNER